MFQYAAVALPDDRMHRRRAGSNFFCLAKPWANSRQAAIGIVAATLRPRAARAIEREHTNGSNPLAHSSQAEAGRLCHADRISAAIIFNADQKRAFLARASLNPSTISRAALWRRELVRHSCATR